MVRKEGGSLDDKVLIFIQIHRISGSGHRFFVLWWVSLTFSHIQWYCQILNLPFNVMHWERAFWLKVRFCWNILNLRDPLMMQIFFSNLLWLPWSIMCVYFQPGHFFKTQNPNVISSNCVEPVGLQQAGFIFRSGEPKTTFYNWKTKADE